MNRMRMPLNFSPWSSRVRPSPRSVSSKLCSPSKRRLTRNLPFQRSIRPGSASSTVGGERHAIATGVFSGCDLDGRAHGCLSNNPSEERVPLLIRWEVSEDIPYLLRCGVDVERRADCFLHGDPLLQLVVAFDLTRFGWLTQQLVALNGLVLTGSAASGCCLSLRCGYG